VLAVEDPALEPYTADGFVAALAQLVAGQAPTYVLFPHTYLARDFVPKLAAALDAPLIADVVGVVDRGGTTVFTRLIFQGKLAADVVPEGDAPYLITIQAGAFSADSAARSAVPAPVSAFAVTVDAASIRQKPDAPFREARQAVDLSQAGRIARMIVDGHMGEFPAGTNDRIAPAARHAMAGAHDAPELLGVHV